MDKILVKRAKYACNLGVGASERSKKQVVEVDLEIYCDVSKASKTDDVSFTINYSTVYNTIKTVIEEREYKLIETLAESIASTVLENFKTRKVLVRVIKPNGLKNRAESSGVEIIRENLKSTTQRIAFKKPNLPK